MVLQNKKPPLFKKWINKARNHDVWFGMKNRSHSKLARYMGGKTMHTQGGRNKGKPHFAHPDYTYIVHWQQDIYDVLNYIRFKVKTRRIADGRKKFIIIGPDPEKYMMSCMFVCMYVKDFNELFVKTSGRTRAGELDRDPFGAIFPELESGQEEDVSE